MKIISLVTFPSRSKLSLVLVIELCFSWESPEAVGPGRALESGGVSVFVPGSTSLQSSIKYLKNPCSQIVQLKIVC